MTSEEIRLLVTKSHNKSSLQLPPSIAIALTQSGGLGSTGVLWQRNACPYDTTLGLPNNGVWRYKGHGIFAVARKSQPCLLGHDTDRVTVGRPKISSPGCGGETWIYR